MQETAAEAAMLTGIADLELVSQSITHLDAAADSIALEVRGLEQNAAELIWSGQEVSDRHGALLAELRGVENTIRTKVLTLEEILRGQVDASDGLIFR